jgi:hypothetical protein
MKVSPVRKYEVAKYPQERFAQHHQSKILKHVQNGTALAFFTAILQGCGGGGINGGMIEPDRITEQEARIKIEAVFARNNISLESGVPVQFTFLDTLDFEFRLDGYNASLLTGYEYISDNDPDTRKDYGNNYSFYGGLEYVLADTSDDKNILLFSVGVEEGREELLDTLTQNFIDDLRAGGIL